MKALTLALLMLLVVPFASAQKASNGNCSKITGTQSSDNRTYTNGGLDLSETITFHVTCVQTPPLGSAKYYDQYNSATATGNTRYAVDIGVDKTCPPVFTHSSSIPAAYQTSTGVMNRDTFTNTGSSWTVHGSTQTGGATYYYNSCDYLGAQQNESDCNAQQCPPQTSPIIVDLDGKGFFLTSEQNGVQFDITGSGEPLQISWTAPGANNAFLALPGSDGLVHNGQQLFGNFTPQPDSPNPNGFAALAVFDLPENGGNGDGVIDQNDAVYNSLRLWRDDNHDGISQPSELHTLQEFGVVSISLKYSLDRKTDRYGNAFTYRGSDVTDLRGHDVPLTIYDVFLITCPQP